MTATLRLRLDKDLDGRGAFEGLVANVYALDDEGHRVQARDRRDLVIPAGRNEIRGREVAVEPGNYVIEATFPSGDVVSDQVTVAEGDDREVVLEGPQSPNEWLSWQQFIGNVPGLPDVEPARNLSARPPSRRAPRATVDRIEHFVRGVEFNAKFGGAPGQRSGVTGMALVLREAPERPAPVHRREPAWPTVWFVRTPVPALRGDEPGGDAWKILGAKDAGKNVLATISAGTPTEAVRQLEQPAWRRYAFGGDGSLGYGANATAGGDQLPRRYIVAIRSRGVVELACLPVPWDSGQYGQVPVELLVRHHPLPGEAVLALSPDDPAVRSALGYMGAGSLANARLLFDRAKDMLFGKVLNPLAAAAGGYVLLATEQGTGEQPWHPWIENLANWFAWLPDGMIQYGRLRMLRRQGEADVTEARRAFFAAFDRGIPYYSLGLQWLVDGLSLLASRDDKEARVRLAAAQHVIWRANLQQPFTTLRLRDR